MITLIKAAVLGAILTLIGSAIFGSAGTTAGFLDVHIVTLMDYHAHWSWPLFLASTGLAGAIMVMMK
jgi:hypothetical protein